MQQIQQQIHLFHTLFYVCLGLCVFCLVLSIFFFFKFDIRNIFNARTGRSVKKTVQRVEEMNAKTGPLRRPAGRGNTGTLPLANIYAEETGATEVLRMEEREALTPEKAQQEVDESFGMFRIEKCVLLIHTEKER